MYVHKGIVAGCVAVAIAGCGARAVHAQTADRFNLRCKIEASWGEWDGKRTDIPLKPESVHEPFTLQVDLAGKSWCKQNYCSDVSELDYDANEIRFERQRVALFTPKDFTIRRRTGEFRLTDFINGVDSPLVIEVGRCTPAPFTAFPRPKF